jgi:exosortase A-associated hydrolase 2
MQAQFLDLNARRLFCNRLASHDARWRVLVLPPFGEEMNKCRRLMALCARALAADGCDVLWPDLYGTGDSSGDFEDAGWDSWRADVAALAAWHADQVPLATPALLAVRSGALLVDAMPAMPQGRVVLWQPVLNGGRFLQQFLRLRVMSQRMSGGSESMAQLEQTLAAGSSVEVAGYTLSARLASGLAAAQLTTASLAHVENLCVLEFKTDVDGTLTLPMQKLLAALTDQGRAASGSCVVAEQFWATQEISAPPSVVEATRAAFAAS